MAGDDDVNDNDANLSTHTSIKNDHHLKQQWKDNAKKSFGWAKSTQTEASPNRLHRKFVAIPHPSGQQKWVKIITFNYQKHDYSFQGARSHQRKRKIMRFWSFNLLFLCVKPPYHQSAMQTLHACHSGSLSLTLSLSRPLGSEENAKHNFVHPNKKIALILPWTISLPCRQHQTSRCLQNMT